uniref:Uncharacterized protein n=1 Tax=Oryza glumipatula TaxID=40148 RepID=A0A0D9Z9V0_9ORYZ
MARPSADHSSSLQRCPWRSQKVSAATPCPSSRTPGMAPTTSASPASPLTSRRCCNILKIRPIKQNPKNMDFRKLFK